MFDFQPGNKAIVKYWKELSDGKDWNYNFFCTHSGKQVSIIRKLTDDLYQVSTKDEDLIVNDRAIKRISFVPDELFEI